MICDIVRVGLRGDWWPCCDCGDIRTLGDAPPSKCKRLRGELRNVIVDVDFVGVRRIESIAAVDDGILSGDQVIERRRPRWRIITEQQREKNKQTNNNFEWKFESGKTTTIDVGLNLK